MGAINSGNKNFKTNLTLNNKEQQEINSRNRYLDIDTSYSNKKLTEDQKINIDHDALPGEAKANIDALRFKLKKAGIYDTGKETFNKEHLKKAKQLYSKDTILNRNFKAFKDEDLIWIMNNIAQNDVPNNNDTMMAQSGGIIDSAGQYKFPGEVTIIPSNSITMDKIPYEMFGIDNLGNIKLMKPDQNYQFKGSVVTEYPFKKDAATLKKLAKK